MFKIKAMRKKEIIQDLKRFFELHEVPFKIKTL